MSTPTAPRGQFVAAQDESHLPPGWQRRTLGSWTLAVNDLPVFELRDSTGSAVGWCLGFPLTAQRADGTLPFLGIDEFLADTYGRFALLLLEHGVVLDAYGSLGAVYAEDAPVVASTASLIAGDDDHDLRRVLGFPQHDVWLPAGLTFRHGVRRLLANHRLDVDSWRPVRHWQPPPAGGVADVTPVVRAVRTAVDRVVRQAPLALTLTAGRDSRMILACAREHAAAADVITFSPGHDTPDVHISTRMAKSLGLRHRILPIEHATEAQRQAWLEVTGAAVAGPIADIHPTLRHVDPRRPLLPGVAGALGRGHYWRATDEEHTPIDGPALAARMRMAHNPRLVHALQDWLDALPPLTTFQTLDLAFIEHRLSCWSAPQHYGNQYSLFEMAPLSSRAAFDSILRLPHEFRAADGVFTEICRVAWPELLRWPVNEYTGVRGAYDRALRRAKRSAKRLLQRA